MNRDELFQPHTAYVRLKPEQHVLVSTLPRTPAQTVSPRNLGSAALLLGLLAGWAAWLGDVSGPAQFEPDAEGLTIARVQRSASGLGGWQETVLPDNWRDAGLVAREQWYRVEFAIPNAESGLWGLLMPSVDLNAKLFLNGALLGVNGRMTEPVTQNWNRPLLFAIPNQLLRPNGNELLVQVRGPSVGTGLLGAMRIGPHAQLQRAFDERYLRQIELPRLLTIALLVLAGGVTLTHWLRRTHRRDRWLALGLLFAALALLRFHWQQVPLHSAHWSLLQHWFVCAMLTSMACWMRSIPRIAQQAGLTQLAPAMLGWLVLAGAIAMTLAAPTAAATAWVNQWLPTLCSGLALWALQHRIRFHRAGFTWIALAMLLCLGVLIVDLLAAAWSGDRISVKAALIAAPLGLASAMAISLQRALSLQRELLPQRLAAANPILGERHRILADVSEGVGSRLHSAMDMLEDSNANSTELKSVIADALTDLSLMQDAVGDQKRSLLSLMQSLQERLEPTISAAGLRSEWDVSVATQCQQIDENGALQILRIVQESIANVLKHANASGVRVRATLCPTTGQAQIQISDDGQGFSVTGAGGRGLHNMQHRAKGAGIALQINSSDDGTEIHLQL